MRVLIANPPWSRPGYYGVRAGSRWPHFEAEALDYCPFPFSMAYPASALEALGHEVSLVDACAERMERAAFLDRVTGARPDVVVMEVSTPSIVEDLETLSQVRARVGTGVPVVFAGLHERMFRPDFLAAASGLDAVFAGEYDDTLLEWVEARERGRRDLSGIRGLVWRDGGEVRANPRRDSIPDLDRLPWPARHLLPMERYHDEPGGIPRPSVQMWASRGCPYRCSFCAWPQITYGDNKYRVRAVERVVDEMESMVADWGYRSVYFDDDTFNMGDRRCVALAREIRRRGLGVEWAFMGRADTSSPRAIEEMVASGLRAVKFGVESAEQGIIDHVDKRLDLGKVRESVAACRSLGVKVHLTFMFGLPGETRESMESTVALARELDPDSLQMTIATPFPGSRYWDELRDKGHLTSEDFNRFDGFRSAVVRTEALEAEAIQAFVLGAQREWEARKRGQEGLRPQASAATSRRVSVVIPTHEGAGEWLPQCLSALGEQREPPVEWIAVFDGGAAELARFVKSVHPHLRVVETEGRRGFAGAANAGIRAATSPFVALLNDDAEPEPGWIGAMVDAALAFPEAGMVACRVLRKGEEGRLDSAGHGLTRWGYAFNIGAGEPDGGRFDADREVFGAVGCAALYRRAMLEDVGLFDEAMEAYLEDVDLSVRARLRGWGCRYAAGAVVRHRGSASYRFPRDAWPVERVARNQVRLALKGMPRAVLARSAVPAVLFQAGLIARRAVVDRQVAAHTRGLLRAVADVADAVKARKGILGARRLGDGDFEALLRRSEEDLALASGGGARGAARRSWHRALSGLSGPGIETPRGAAEPDPLLQWESIS